jgi:hypothetical protein
MEGLPFMFMGMGRLARHDFHAADGIQNLAFAVHRAISPYPVNGRKIALPATGRSRAGYA